MVSAWTVSNRLKFISDKAHYRKIFCFHEVYAVTELPILYMVIQLELDDMFTARHQSVPSLTLTTNGSCGPAMKKITFYHMADGYT
jgi:hypothetical protein